MPGVELPRTAARGGPQWPRSGAHRAGVHPRGRGARSAPTDPAIVPTDPAIVRIATASHACLRGRVPSPRPQRPVAAIPPGVSLSRSRASLRPVTGPLRLLAPRRSRQRPWPPHFSNTRAAPAPPKVRRLKVLPVGLQKVRRAVRIPRAVRPEGLAPLGALPQKGLLKVRRVGLALLRGLRLKGLRVRLASPLGGLKNRLVRRVVRLEDLVLLGVLPQKGLLKVRRVGLAPLEGLRLKVRRVGLAPLEDRHPKGPRRNRAPRPNRRRPPNDRRRRNHPRRFASSGPPASGTSRRPPTLRWTRAPPR
jgi:hypothetical protein